MKMLDSPVSEYQMQYVASSAGEALEYYRRAALDSFPAPTPFISGSERPSGVPRYLTDKAPTKIGRDDHLPIDSSPRCSSPFHAVR